MIRPSLSLAYLISTAIHNLFIFLPKVCFWSLSENQKILKQFLWDAFLSLISKQFPKKSETFFYKITQRRLTLKSTDCLFWGKIITPKKRKNLFSVYSKFYTRFYLKSKIPWESSIRKQKHVYFCIHKFSLVKPTPIVLYQQNLLAPLGTNKL